MKIGDVVYLFRVDISTSCRVTLGIAAKVKMIEENKFIVLRVISGKSLKVGEEIRASYYGRSNFFRKIEDGIKYWNSKILNAEDKLTYDYERKKKALRKRILEL